METGLWLNQLKHLIQSPAFHMSHPIASATASPTGTRPIPRANSIVANMENRTPKRIKDHTHPRDSAILVKSNIESSPQRTAKYSESDYPSPRSLKNMELRLHDVVNSPKATLSRTESQSSTTSAKACPLALTKLPEIRLARVVTPTGTPTSNFSSQESSQIKTKQESLEFGRSSGYSNIQIKPDQIEMPKQMYAPSTQHTSTKNDQILTSVPYPYLSKSHQNNPYQSQQQSMSQQQYNSGFSPVKSSLQHVSPSNLHVQSSNATAQPPPELGTHLSNVTPSAFQRTHSPSPHSMLNHSMYPAQSSTNHLSHPTPAGQTRPPNYTTRQLSPQLNANPSGMTQVNPGLSQQSCHYSPKNTHQFASPHQQHLPPSHPHAHGMRNSRDTHLLQDGSQSSPQHPQQVSPGSHLIQGIPQSLLQHPQQASLGTHHLHDESLLSSQPVRLASQSSPMKSLSVPPGLRQQQQQMRTMQANSQMNNFCIQPSLSQQQAILHQRMLQQQQQQQQMLQAQALQQQLNMQQQSALCNTSQTLALSHPTFQSGQYPQLNQQSPIQLPHLNMLQKLGQETNRSPLGTTEAHQMAGLHAHRPQNVQQLNGPSMPVAAVQGGMYVSNPPQVFPFNPHLSSR